jgi:hypothetical protein
MREGGDGTVTPSTTDPGDFRPWLDDGESGYQGMMTPGGDSLMTPGLMTPGGELEVEMKKLMRMDSRPLTEDMETPYSLDPVSTEQPPLHPLNPARLYSKLARRALVSSHISTILGYLVIGKCNTTWCRLVIDRQTTSILAVEKG